MHAEIFDLIPESTFLQLGIGNPRMAAWCSWNPIKQSQTEGHAAGIAGTLVGHLLGGSIGGEIGKLVGRTAAMAYAAGTDGDTDVDGSVYIANLGVVMLTDTSVAIIDCRRTVTITESGVRRKHVDGYIDERVIEGRKFQISAIPLKSVRASLRDEASTLQLVVSGGETWRLKIARIAGAPDAKLLVRTICGLPELPSAEEFIASAIKSVPPAALLDAMVVDDSVQPVMRRLRELERDKLASLLTNVSHSTSSSFAVWIEAWLTERAAHARSASIGWVATAAVGMICALYAIVQPPSHGTEIRWLAIGLAAIALFLAYIWRLIAVEAQWFHEQLVRFRTTRMRR
jgi:hypothetical protein